MVALCVAAGPTACGTGDIGNPSFGLDPTAMAGDHDPTRTSGDGGAPGDSAPSDASLLPSDDARVDDDQTPVEPTITSAAFGDGTMEKTVDPSGTETVKVEVQGESLPTDGSGLGLTDDLSTLTPTFNPISSTDIKTVLRIGVSDLADGVYDFRVQIHSATSPRLRLIVISPECTDDAHCDDHLPCNGVERCVAGECAPGTGMPDCNDNVPCTIDECDDSAGGCVHTPAPGECPSGADEAAAYRLLKVARQTQLVRPKTSNSPTKWNVYGPATTSLPDGSGLDPGTVGFGNTIVQAVSDYEAKQNVSFGVAGSLDAREISLLTWYSAMDAATGPTALRRDLQGRYHAEYYRPSTGTQHHGPFSSMVEALLALQLDGL